MEGDIIKISTKRFLTALLLLYGGLWIALIISGIVAFALLGVFLDYIWFIIMLIWICLIAPLMIAYLYIWHGMKSFTVLNPVPHKIYADEKGLIVCMLSSQHSEEENPEELSDETDYVKIENDIKEEPVYKEQYCRNVTKNDIREIKVFDRDIIILFKDDKAGFLSVPADLIEKSAELKQFIRP